jgi:hypothetical protein
VVTNISKELTACTSRLSGCDLIEVWSRNLPLWTELLPNKILIITARSTCSITVVLKPIMFSQKCKIHQAKEVKIPTVIWLVYWWPYTRNPGSTRMMQKVRTKSMRVLVEVGSICYEYGQEQQDGEIMATVIKCCHSKINVHWTYVAGFKRASKLGRGSSILWRDSPLLDNGSIKRVFAATNTLVEIRALPRDWRTFRSNGWNRI